ncbi:hypothetical protein ABES02_29335 [Neobacillus pocheonensis]|uniref:hypothetical protein n=1 Tax=Neobacillus pocheonensis TaxID=363869 RepID=UPI003D2696E2
MKNKLLRTALSVTLAAALTVGVMTPVNTALAAQTAAPLTTNIKIVNNPAGTPDTLTVSGLNPGDIVKIYTDPSTTNPLDTKTVPAGSTAVTFTINQLGTAAGTIYVTSTSGSNTESKRVSKQYTAEPATPRYDASQITVVNNPPGTSDTVTIVNVNPGDIIKVYQDPLDTTVRGTITAADTTAVVTINQLGSSPGAVYVTVTRSPYGESLRTFKTYAGEAVTPQITANNITIVNNLTGTDDTVTLRNLNAGDIVKVYSSKMDASPIGTGTVTAGQNSIVISIQQLGVNEGVAYISITRGTMPESERTAKSYVAEPKSGAPAFNDVKIITNPDGTRDAITINNVNATDIIRLYKDASTTPISVTTAGKNQLPPFSQWNLDSNATETSNFSLTLKATATGQGSYYDAGVLPNTSYAFSIGNPNAGTVNVKTLDQNKKVISTKYTSTQANISTTFTTETNAAYVQVELTNTSAGTFVFTSAQLELGSNVTTFEPMDFKASKNLFPPLSKWKIHSNAAVTGDYTMNLYSTASRQMSSIRVKVAANTKYTYSLEHNGQIVVDAIDSNGNTTSLITATTAQSGTFLTPANAAFVDVYLTNPESGVYSFSKMQLEQGDHATAFEPNIATKVIATIKLPNLGQDKGTIYYTIQSPGSAESGRVSRSYGAEEPTTPPSYKAIKVVNNEGSEDTVSVFGLTPGDVIKVYSGKVTNELLGSATVQSGATSGTVTISQLGTTAGIVYVTVTTSGKTESIRVAKSYSAE